MGALNINENIQEFDLIVIKNAIKWYWKRRYNSDTIRRIGFNVYDPEKTLEKFSQKFIFIKYIYDNDGLKFVLSTNRFSAFNNGWMWINNPYTYQYKLWTVKELLEKYKEEN